jgi:hypothetical protein
MLTGMGQRPERVGGWWTSVSYPELGGRTIVRASLDGDHDLVAGLVGRFYEQSRENAYRLSGDPERLADGVSRIAEIDRRRTA